LHQFVRATVESTRDGSQTDGACPDATGEPTVCPRHDKRIQKVDLPSDAKFVEAIVELDTTGKRTPLACSR
jgi:hypothetical protein